MKSTTTKKRVCVMCGSEYTYCPNCSKDAGKPIWMVAFCDDTCHEVYRILNDLGFKKITENEATKQLKEIDLSKKTFPEITQKQLDALLKTKEETTATTKTASKSFAKKAKQNVN